MNVDADVLRLQFEEDIEVNVDALPGLTLYLEQRTAWDICATGGLLWRTDRIVAAYLADEGFQEDNGIILVLGCGGVPLSGLIAYALGWTVVLTDLDVVLPQTQRNVTRNVDALQAARHTRRFHSVSGPEEPIAIQVRSLPFGDMASLGSALEATDGEQHGKASERKLVILCSECIWQLQLHQPLLETIASALCHTGNGNASALVAFERRDDFTEQHFLEQAKSVFELQVTEVDISHAISCVRWPVDEGAVSGKVGIPTSERFVMYRLATGPIDSPVFLRRRLRWNLASLSPS